jgi:FtsH-binding integral membrane protein
MLRAGLAAVSLPMLVLMGVSFVFPIGGILGVLLSGVFVVVSAGGLLYQINAVLHRLRATQTVEGAYLITMGVLVLYWNVLTLLMRLRR